MSDEITKQVEPVEEVKDGEVVDTEESVDFERAKDDQVVGAEPKGEVLEPATEPASEASTLPLEANIETVSGEPLPVESAVVIPGESEAKPRSLPEPTPIESTPEVVASTELVNEVNEPSSIPISNPKESIPETSHSSLEPNPRPYSLDPKLNKIIEAFVRGMNRSKENLILARKATTAKMMKKVYKVMDLFKKKKSIKNDDVEKFLHTDDSTATRYLNILTKEGKVKREGTNNKTHYIKVE